MIPHLKVGHQPTFTREEFRTWVAKQPRGRYERFAGRIVTLGPERVAHALIKGRVWRALDDALLAAEANCTAIPDGATVEIDDATDYEPNVVVSCGDTLDLNSVIAPTPVILVEVSSPSTRSIDGGDKLADYFRLPSVQHYLVVSAQRRLVIHHRRGDERIETRIVTSGSISLDPPGIAVSIDDFYARIEL